VSTAPADNARRDLALQLGPGDRVGVTGASGFIGSAVVRVLTARGASPVALVEPGAEMANLDGLDVERIEADVRDAEGIGGAVRGCRALFHVAALYRFWARDNRQFYDINVGGTLNVLDAVRAAGVERMVYTSTVGTLGLDAADHGVAADERNYPDVSHLFGSYKRSKYVAEHEVLRAAAQGLPVTLVMPTFPLGPRDRVPTPTGNLILEYLNGRVPGFVDTTLNVAHVDDVAEGHVLALERGDVGRSYILGGENYSLQHLLEVLAQCTGLPEAKLRVPRALSLGVAHVSEFIEGRLLHKHPTVPIEAARMSTTKMAFDDSRARKELGYAPRPAEQAVFDSARWFVENGYVKDSRRARITWRTGI
jgi:dihydroflavonol-4-reductase